ncbi:hypothetical protein ACQY0O_006198 [Thecaphora frezii]
MSLLRSVASSASRSLAVSVAASTTANPLRAFSSSSRLAQQSSEKDPQLGDYPELPAISLQTRKYSPNWWDPQEKRNFGETLHEQDDVLGVWAPDVHAVPAASALRQFLMAVGVVVLFGSTVYATTPQKPALPRTYPRDGLAAELGGSQVAAPAEGAFNKSSNEEDDE